MSPPAHSRQIPPLQKMEARIADGVVASHRFRWATVAAVSLVLALAALFLALDAIGKQSQPERLLHAGGLVALTVVAVGLQVRMAARAHRLLHSHMGDAESALSQTQSIIACTREGVLIVDDQGRIQAINPAAEKMFGRPAARLLNQNLSLLIPDHVSLREQAAFPWTTTATGQREGLHCFPVEMIWNELKLEGRRHFCALVRDVSVREASETVLRHIGLGVGSAAGNDFVRSSLKQLSLALGSERAFIVEILGEGIGALATLTMAERGELRGTVPIDLHNSVCAEILGRGFRAFAEGAQQQFPEDVMLAENHARAFAGAPILDHRGRPIGVIGVLDARRMEDGVLVENTLRIFGSRAAAEIERKRFEESLAAEKERLTVTLRSIGDGCINIDTDGRLVTLNPVAERLTGWSVQDATGRPVAEVVHLIDERTRRRCKHLLQRIVQHGTTEGQSAASLIVPREGEERRVETSCTPIRDRAGRKLGAIVVLRDISDRQRVDEEREKAEKLESLGVVAGGIAHDFNNILTTILGNVTLALGAREVSPVISERLAAARKAAQRAQELAGQLLTFAKGGSPIKQPTNLARLLVDTVHCVLASSRTTCDAELTEDLWPVEADPGQLAQVIANLAVNADQAMPSGGNILVTAENLDLPTGSVSLGLRAGRWVHFSIDDHGIGISEQYLKKIFDPYFTTKPTGSGLGLATAYSIVKNHGGIIFAESQPGVGSTFNVYLPASAQELRKAAEPVAAAPRGTGRVLVLDDEEAICMLVTCALEPLGYEVTETQDGLVALERYEESMKTGRKYDLVISDLTMPGRMSGQETIRRLRELDPDVHAIVSSGYANDPVMSRYQEFGFCGMIAKPYEIAALGRKVAEVMDPAQRPRVIYHEFDQRRTA